jgi:thiamine pyrophosphate-dependent acetolactate synthase large subunit-like protein
VLTIIHNNEAWGIIRAGQKNMLGFELGTSLAGTDYAAIARGFGCSRRDLHLLIKDAQGNVPRRQPRATKTKRS